jgi:hypothetical protein
MLHFTLWGREAKMRTLAESIGRLRANPTLLSELRQLLAYKREKIFEVPLPLDLPFPCPLELHADYRSDEILAALGLLSFEAKRELREGVLHMRELKVDLLFVTLNKTEKEYSPTTMYEDYAISDELFHWQTQSTTSVGSPTGQRYINHQRLGHTILLFVREDKKNERGLTSPYAFLGPVDYVSHEGSRPMSIIWRLRHKLPARLLPHVRRLANG